MNQNLESTVNYRVEFLSEEYEACQGDLPMEFDLKSAVSIPDVFRQKIVLKWT